MKRQTAGRGTAPKNPRTSPRGTQTVQVSTSQTKSPGWTQWLKQEAVAATILLDPNLCDCETAIIRFSGHRLGVGRRMEQRDRFITDEVVEDIVPGSGPLSVTTRVYDVNPGEWAVTAELLAPSDIDRGRKGDRRAPPTRSLAPAVWSWRKWSLSPGPETPVETCPAPLAKIGRAPGMIPGIWGAMVGLGVVLAVALTALIFAHDHRSVGRLLLVALLAVLSGAIGAKAWYVVQSPQHRFDGWCIQGFVAGLVLGAVPSLAAQGLPIGVSLDAAAPGMFLAMAVGRVGCFFAGCCVGRPTASRWGLWSSDQRVGVRRIPTQLLESALTLAIGTALLIVLLTHRPAIPGALLATGLAAYTLGRQGLLLLRVERRRSAFRSSVVAVVAAVVLVAGVLALTVSSRPISAAGSGEVVQSDRVAPSSKLPL